MFVRTRFAPTELGLIFFRELGYKHSAPTELKKHWDAAKAKGWLKNSDGLKTQRVK